MRPEFMIERQGRAFVLYAGLLDEAHSLNVKSIRTTLLQIPAADNGNVAICRAEVEMEHGTFTGIGDASPQNVSRQMLTCLIRMAETRAKARALRDAVNVGAVAFEELDDSDGGNSANGHHTTPTPPAAPDPMATAVKDARQRPNRDRGEGKPPAAGSADPPSAAQRTLIANLAKQAGLETPAIPATKAEANALIEKLKAAKA